MDIGENFIKKIDSFIKMFWWQTQEEDEVAPEIELSALVNYIQPVHFKGFEACDSEYTSEKALSNDYYWSFLSCSFHL